MQTLVVLLLAAVLAFFLPAVQNRVRGALHARPAAIWTVPFLLVAIFSGAADHSEDSGYWHASDMLRQSIRPTAILGCGLLITMGVLAAIRETGVACPGEISLIGFDDFAWSRLLSPALTMIRQPASELGAAAAKAVLKRMRAPDEAGGDKVILPTQLIVRESTAPPPQRGVGPQMMCDNHQGPGNSCNPHTEETPRREARSSNHSRSAIRPA